MAQSEIIITTNNLCKDYKVIKRNPGLRGMMQSFLHPNISLVHAVAHLNLAILRGELVGYIGPNGSGKSTTIKMLAGILEPSSGEIEVAGLIPSKNRIENARNIGVVFGQRTQLWWDLPVQETFELLRRIYEIPDSVYRENVAQFKELLDLKGILDKPVRQLSLGQRMRAEFAAALLHNPKILFLDEPTIGLDVSVKHKIWEFIQTINKERQVTMLLTSHDMQDIEALSNRLIVINQGTLIFDGTVEELKSRYIKNKRIRFFVERTLSGTIQIDDLPNSAVAHGEGSELLVTYPQDISSTKIVSAVMGKFDVLDMKLETGNIDDVVMEVYHDA